MVKYKIIDNFLEDDDFTKLTNVIIPPQQDYRPFSWVYQNEQVSYSTENEQDLRKKFNNVTNIEPVPPNHDWMFTRLLYGRGYVDEFMFIINPIVEKFEKLESLNSVLAFYRIHAVFQVKKDKVMRSGFHLDLNGEPLKHTSMITSILYLNTTNGPTILEDGTEIECRANRLVSFPYETYHAATCCTDQPYRIVLNFNYFADMGF